jgi:hypothetical protein
MHGSYLNNKSAPLPEGENVRVEVERFLCRLGYRLVLKKLEHPARIQAGKQLKLVMKWRNTGSAPCYRPYRVAYRLTNESAGDKVLIGNVTVEKWMPGHVETFSEEFIKAPPELPPGPVADVIDIVEVPDDMPAGRYRLAIGVVGGKSTEPVVHLGIKGRTKDGWYPLSKIEITK